jgi:hypothetical protein
MLAFGPVGWVLGGISIATGIATLAFGTNEVVAGITGTNYIQQWTGISDSTYNSLYLGLNIASGIATVGGRIGMKITGTVNHVGTTPGKRTPYLELDTLISQNWRIFAPVSKYCRIIVYYLNI